MREPEAAFRVLTESMPQIVWSTFADGTVDYSNPRWLEFSGLLNQQAQGSGWGVILHPEDHDITMAAWKRAIETGEPYRFEHRLRNSKGEYRWFLSQALPKRSEDGKILKWYGTCTDIDEQKRTQSALTEATRAKDHFPAVLSHELRTPLTPALLSVSAMLDSPEIGPSCRPELTMIRDNIVLEARLIDDLLDISRIAHGKMIYRFEVVDLHGVIRRVVENCSGEIELRGHSLTVGARSSRAPSRRRLGAAPTDALEPALQRREVHSGARPDHRADAVGFQGASLRRGRRQWYRHRPV